MLFLKEEEKHGVVGVSISLDETYFRRCICLGENLRMDLLGHKPLSHTHLVFSLVYLDYYSKSVVFILSK